MWGVHFEKRRVQHGGEAWQCAADVVAGRETEIPSLAAGRKQTEVKWEWGQARLSQNLSSSDRKYEPPTVD